MDADMRLAIEGILLGLRNAGVITEEHLPHIVAGICEAGKKGLHGSGGAIVAELCRGQGALTADAAVHAAPASRRADVCEEARAGDRDACRAPPWRRLCMQAPEARLGSFGVLPRRPGPGRPCVRGCTP